MKEIAFDSLLLIAADDVSQQAINQLRSEGMTFPDFSRHFFTL